MNRCSHTQSLKTSYRIEGVMKHSLILKPLSKVISCVLLSNATSVHWNPAHGQYNNEGLGHALSWHWYDKPLKDGASWLTLLTSESSHLLHQFHLCNIRFEKHRVISFT